MPMKFKENLGYPKTSAFSFTNYLDFGQETKLPELMNGGKSISIIWWLLKRKVNPAQMKIIYPQT
jgi:hypothetical protein